MKTVILILPLEAMANINPRDSSGVAAGVTAEAIAGVTTGVLMD